jgi:hypothetical protein
MSGAESQFRITRPFVYRSESNRAPTANSTGTQRARSRGVPESRLALTDPAVHILARCIQVLGSYAAIALILQGGNLIALALWTLQHRAWIAALARRGLSSVRTAAERLIFPR